MRQAHDVVDAENVKRRDFLQQYGNNLPELFRELVPSLKDLLVIRTTIPLDEYERLPEIDLEADKRVVMDE